MMSSIAEVGLVRFAGVALEVAEAVLLDYRIKSSKRVFTPPPLLAILYSCAMRTELCAQGRGPASKKASWM